MTARIYIAGTAGLDQAFFAHLGAAGLFLPTAGTTPRVFSTCKTHVRLSMDKLIPYKHIMIVAKCDKALSTICPQTSGFSCTKIPRPSTALRYITHRCEQTQVTATSAGFCFWATADLPHDIADGLGAVHQLVGRDVVTNHLAHALAAVVAPVPAITRAMAFSLAIQQCSPRADLCRT